MTFELNNAAGTGGTRECVSGSGRSHVAALTGGRVLRCLALVFAFVLLASQPFEVRAQAPEERGFAAGEGPNGPVTAVAVQPDGKIIIIGAFDYAGRHVGIARLNADGSFDESFGASADGTIWAVRVQSDGRILVGGSFQHMNGWLSPGLVRLNPDGSVDRTFEPRVSGTVCSVAEMADGRIVIAGFFSEVGGQRRYSVARLNRGGSLDESFDPGWGPDSYVFALAVQPDGRVVLGGMFRWVNGQPRDRVARLNADGSLDAGFNPGADRPVRAVAVQKDGRIILGGEFFYVARQQSYYLTRLNADGSPDMGFFNRGTNGEVRAIALQPDGRIIIGGNFLQTGTEWRSFVARLDLYGQVDGTFVNTRANAAVNAVFIQPDGRIVVGGEFTEMGSQPRRRIARLKADGTLDLPGPLDASFVVPGLGAADAVAVQPDGRILVAGIFERGTVWDVVRVHPDGTLDGGFNVSTDPGHHGSVVTIALQPDGRVIIGGYFSQVNGRPRNGLARLNPDGSLDESFVANTGPGENVYAAYVLPDGRVLVGGYFNTINGQPSRYLARLNADGSLDTSFAPGIANAGPYTFAHQEGGKVLVGGQSLDGGITDLARLNPDGSFDRTFNARMQGFPRSIVVQPDGRILLGGYIYALDGRQVNANLCRLNPDGSVDHTFQGTANYTVHALALQADGRVLVGGRFTSVNGYPQGYLARLKADGTLDLSFKPGVDHFVYNVILQADGRVLVGGSFYQLGGEPHKGFGRLKNTEVARQSLTLDAAGETVNWSRTGTGPEVERVTFEYTDGEGGFRELGAGVRHAGGWHLSGLGLPAGRTVTIRARGFYQSGAYWEASSMVEAVGIFDVPAAQP